MSEYRNTTKWKDRKQSDYRLLHDTQRQLPCCAVVRVRVKIIEPGVQSRWCEVCRVWRFFRLSEVVSMPGLLKLHWLTDSEVVEYKAGLTGDDWRG